MPNQIQDTAFHKSEVLTVLESVRKSAAGVPRKRYPSRFSPALWSEFIRSRGGKLSGSMVSEWCRDSLGPNHSIRQVHDFYGWMAKHGKNGGCAGTLYRSVEFMSIEQRDRDGSKSQSRNIHIEHAVPVAALEKVLGVNAPRMKGPCDLHWLLMCKSVCVALSSNEERNLRLAGVPASRSNSFDQWGECKDQFPFRRYARLISYSKDNNFDFRIFNVITGKEIDLENFTFQDHVKTMHAASRLIVGASEPMLYKLDLFDPAVWAPR
jgi:hypothetical protein